MSRLATATQRERLDFDKTAAAKGFAGYLLRPAKPEAGLAVKTG
jgi:hypothetical protein